MITFEEVTKVYEPDVTAVDDVTFTIDKGEFVFVVGPSGSGKSTIIRLLLKELEPTSGRIIVGGRDLGRLKRSKVPLLRRNVGCVFQDFKLLRDRTAFENVAYALRVQGESTASIRKKVPEVLNLVGLAHKTGSRPDELSGGEQQRVSIARAVVNHPPLLICDEPTGNLDPDTSVGIMQLLHRINTAGGTTILMVTHDREMVDKMRKRVIALDSGKHRPRRAPRRVRDGMTRFKLMGSEAFRSIGSNLSTSFAATMTVLIGMCLLGLFIALGSWVVSWSDHVKSQLEVKVFFVDERHAEAGERRRRATSRHDHGRDQGVPVRLQARGAGAHAARSTRSSRRTSPRTRFLRRTRSRRARAEERRRRLLGPPTPTRSRSSPASSGSRTASRPRSGSSRWRA